MINRHRRIHAPEYQTGMHIHRGRPACFSDRREPLAGKPFWEEGAICGGALSRETWFALISHTPACLGCARGRMEPLA